MNGTYARTIAGDPKEALRALTGAPCNSHQHANLTADELWGKVVDADKRNYIMACGGVNPDYDDHEGNTTGLQSGHAYSLIGAYDTEGHKLVKLRNPWGKFEWTGRWSDNDKKWTPGMKKAVGFTNEDDGTFHMCIEDFHSIYKYTVVCSFNEGYVFESVEHTEHP